MKEVCINEKFCYSGQLTSTKCPVGGVPVDIKIDNVSQGTVKTDSNGAWRVNIILTKAGNHALTAVAPDGTSCSEAVKVVACAPQRNIETIVHCNLCGSIKNTYSVMVKDADTGTFLATVSFSRIAVEGYKVLEDRYAPTHPTGPTTTKCSDFDTFCANLNLKQLTTKKRSGEVKDKLYNQLDPLVKNNDLTPSQRDTIIAEAERLAVALARRYFVEHYDLRQCPNSNTCKSWGSTALLRTCTSGTFGHSEYKNSSTITV